MPDTKAIDQVLRDAVTSGQVPGVTAAAANADGVMYVGAFGRRSLTGDAAMTTDTVFRIASMTKAITGAAAMQMVEQGKLSLDQPAGEILPFLANPMVLDGTDANGEPKLRPAKGVVTLRKLLTHTAGFVYDTWNGEMNRYAAKTGLPAARTGKIAALHAPLGFDPGERWEYGINIDIAGRMVEVASGQDLESYFQQHLFRPLGMNDTGFVIKPQWNGRQAQVHTRDEKGLTPIETLPPARKSRVLRGRRRPVLHRAGLSHVSARADARRRTQRRANSEAGDRRADGAEPHGRAERAADENVQSADVERLRVVSRASTKNGA